MTQPLPLTLEFLAAATAITHYCWCISCHARTRHMLSYRMGDGKILYVCAVTGCGRETRFSPKSPQKAHGETRA